MECSCTSSPLTEVCMCRGHSSPPISLPGVELKLDGCQIDLLSSDDDSIMEKENDKLLTRAGNGSFKGRYGDTSGFTGSAGNIATNQEGSNSNMSFANKDTSSRTSKDVFLKKINEEETPKTDCKRKILKVVVTVLFIVIVVGVVVIWSLHEGRSRKHLGNQYFDFISKKRVLNVYNKDDDVVLAGYLKTSEFEVGKVRACESDTYDDYCFRFEDGTLFKFFPYQLENTDVNCLNLVWENLNKDLNIPTDCYDIEYGLWYGIPNFQGSFWPLDLKEVSLEEISYRPYWKKTLGHVLENYWLSTEGISIIAHQNLPIKISFNSGNDKRLCLTLDSKGIKTESSYPNLNYSICQGPDIKQTFIATRNNFFPNTNAMDYQNHDFSKIIWMYENKYHNNPENLGEILHKLNTANLPIYLIQFDSQWEDNPGSLRFKVPVRNEIAHHLQGKYSKTRLMLPITAACSYETENFKTGVSERLFAKDPQTGAFKTVRFQKQTCALWDASNPATKLFLKNELNLLQQKGTTEESKFPQAFEFQTIIGNSVFPLLLFENSTDINLMELEFLNVLLDLKKSVLMETAYRLQNRPIFVQVPTVLSNVNGKKCLDYIISGALTAGIHGYPFIVSKPPPEDKIDQELFTRWLEVAMFFPGLKITNMAVNFGDEIINVTKKLSFYRESVIVPTYSDFMHEVEKGYPLLRPLWWINPMDYKTLQISDEFLIGTSMVVAPVLCHGDRRRDIYLPEGSWIHKGSGTVYEGKQWLKDFHVLLGDIPVFQAYIESSMNSTIKTNSNSVTSS